MSLPWRGSRPGQTPSHGACQMARMRCRGLGDQRRQACARLPTLCVPTWP